MYDTPTGKIIGACLLGKPDMVNNLLKTDGGFFPEGGGNIDALAAIDFYAADRRYNLPKIDIDTQIVNDINEDILLVGIRDYDINYSIEMRRYMEPGKEHTFNKREMRFIF